MKVKRKIAAAPAAGKRLRAPMRVSEREGIKLEVSTLSARGRELRDLMTEQSRRDGGWATYYTGTQAQFVKAGIPEYLFAAHGKTVRFRANSQDAFLQRKGSFYDLTLHWDNSGPWYFSAEHPALHELARMVHIDVGWWIGRDDEVPVQNLLDDERAVDYRLPRTKRFRYAKGERRRLSNLLGELYHAIKNTEILPLDVAPVQYEDPGDSVDQIEAAQHATQAVIARLTKRPGAA